MATPKRLTRCSSANPRAGASIAIIATSPSRMEGAKRAGTKRRLPARRIQRPPKKKAGEESHLELGSLGLLNRGRVPKDARPRPAADHDSFGGSVPAAPAPRNREKELSSESAR